jgi:HlyD family secretion protein
LSDQPKKQSVTELLEKQAVASSSASTLLESLKLNKAAYVVGGSAPSFRHWIYWVVGLGVIVMIGWGWKARQPIEVKVQPVSMWYPSQSLTVLNASGYVVAQRKAAISSKATGRLEWLGVAEGDVVKQDQLLARLDSRDVEASLQASRAQAEAVKAQIASVEAERHEASLNYQRTKSLVAEQFMSEASLDQARARLERAEAAVINAQKQAQSAEASAQAAEVNVDYTHIRAPFDGIILTKQANIGDIVTPFSSAADSKGAVVTMADLRSLEVEADVSESAINSIAVHQPCEIILDAFPDQRFEGEVSRMVPTVDRSKATVMTKVRFLHPPAKLLPEMSAKVNFLSAPLPKAVKPLKAVSESAVDQTTSNPVVWWVQAPDKTKNAFAEKDDKSAARKVISVPVKVIALHDGRSMIESSINVGDDVVLNPTSALQTTKMVRVLP